MIALEPDGVAPVDRALRRVRPDHVVTDPKAVGGRRASAAAFEDETDSPSLSMSVYLKSIVEALGLTDASVVYGKPTRWAVASIPVQTLINEEQVVEPDPIVNAAVPHPCDPAHALVHGEKTPKSRRDRIAKASPLVHIVV